MGNKKNRSGPSKTKIKRQKSLAASKILNDSAVLALGAHPSSATVHGTVPQISNSNPIPPLVSPSPSPRSSQHLLSSSHGADTQTRGDSPNINHVLLADWSDDEDADPAEEALDYGSSEEEYVGRSKFFHSPVNATPLFPAASSSLDLPPTVLSPACPQATAIPEPKDSMGFSDHVPSPTSAPSLLGSPAPASSPPVGPLKGASATQHISLEPSVSETPVHPNPVIPPEAASSPDAPVNGVSAAHPNPGMPTVSATSLNPEPSSWSNLFANHRNMTSCPKLCHYSAFTETSGCDLVGDDLEAKCDFWKLCLIGYVAGRSPGFKALQNVIINSWKCDASLIMHESGWLIFKFASDADKLRILSGGPYLVYGRPLILRPMPAFFDFSCSDMHTVPVWVKFPNLPLQCWSLKCLSKIASVLGKPVQTDLLTHTMSRLSYARVLVEVNLLSVLPYSIDINLPNGSLLKQQVIYETLPRFCKHCKILGHLTSTCPKQVAKDSAPAPRASSNVKKSALDRLGPQEIPPVIVKPVGSLPPNSPPLLAEPEIVGVSGAVDNCGAVDNASGGWNIVQSKRIRRKSSPSKHRGRPSIVDHCSDHDLPPVHASLHAPVHASADFRGNSFLTNPAPNSNVRACPRKDKGKAVVGSVESGHPSTGVSSTSFQRRGTRSRNGSAPDRIEGLLPTPPS